MNRQLITDQQGVATVLSPLLKLLENIQKTTPLNLIWWCLALSIMSSTTVRLVPEIPALFSDLLVVLGSGGCVWLWLLARALFRKNHVLLSKKNLVVPLVIVIEGIEALWEPSVSQSINEFYRVFSNVASTVCIAAIIFIVHESLNGYNKIRSVDERRFRIAFIGVFSIPIFVSILWVMGAKAGTFAGDWYQALLTFCGLIVLIGSRLAIQYRLKQTTNSFSQVKATIIADHQFSSALANRILEAIKNDDLLTQPDLKVAALAEFIGEQEYKVSRCITSDLHYRNFNHLLNKHRIDRAIKAFKDPNCQHLKIATIAYDCGFNSLGPFNRAFKQHAGMTPRAYRHQLSTAG